MEEKNKVANLGIQIDASLRRKLDEHAKKEKRTIRAVVELALEEYFDRHSPSSKGEL